MKLNFDQNSLKLAQLQKLTESMIEQFKSKTF